MTDRRMGMWYEELPVGTKVEHAITRTLLTLRLWGSKLRLCTTL